MYFLEMYRKYRHSCYRIIDFGSPISHIQRAYQHAHTHIHTHTRTRTRTRATHTYES